MCGCFLSVDPVTAYSSGDMRFFNRYAYAFNNPYKFTDPDGRAGEFVVLRGVLTFAAADAATPDPSDAAAPAKAAVYATAIAGTAIGGALVYGYNQIVEESSEITTESAAPTEETQTVQQAAEHKKGARPSTTGKHEKGRSRAKADKHGGEKGDNNRDPYGKKPKGQKGPWPPKPKPQEPPKVRR